MEAQIMQWQTLGKIFKLNIEARVYSSPCFSTKVNLAKPISPNSLPCISQHHAITYPTFYIMRIIFPNGIIHPAAPYGNFPGNIPGDLGKSIEAFGIGPWAFSATQQIPAVLTTSTPREFQPAFF